MNVADELQKLQQLLQSGAISEEEFAKAKAKLLNLPPPLPFPSFGSSDPAQQLKMWAMLLHLSLLAGFIVPLGGFIAPIVIWLIKKDELPGIEEHWNIVANWMISALIYSAVSVVLVFVFFIGFFTLTILGVLGVLFPIIGGIKAYNGEAWKYPLSISFFS
jgi:hypothetical protein